MITGDRAWLQRRTRVGFERTGSFPSPGRLRVASGDLCRAHLLAGAKASRALVAAALMTIGAALGYAVFTGFGQPVQRSFWMVTLYLLARLLWRERSALNAIGFAALCLLAATRQPLRRRLSDDDALGDRHCRNRRASRRRQLRAVSSRDAEPRAAGHRSRSAAEGGAISRQPENAGGASEAAHWRQNSPYMLRRRQFVASCCECLNCCWSQSSSKS